MNTFLWILQSLLALMFLFAGYGKLSSSREQLLADGHIQPGASLVPIRILGVFEWLGCIGIIVPWLIGIAPVLTPVAAIGFSFIMIAGIVVHARRKEWKMLPMLLLILACAVTVACFRLSQLY